MKRQNVWTSAALFLTQHLELATDFAPGAKPRGFGSYYLILKAICSLAGMKLTSLGKKRAETTRYGNFPLCFLLFSCHLKKKTKKQDCELKKKIVDLFIFRPHVLSYQKIPFISSSREEMGYIRESYIKSLCSFILQKRFILQSPRGC